MWFVNCPLCGEHKGELISSKDRHGAPLETYCCRSCGMVFNYPLPTNAETQTFYSHEYRRSYKNTDIPKRRHHYRYSRRIIEQISCFPAVYQQAATVLDVGAGSGEFCALMARLNKEVIAVEPTQTYAKYVRQMFGIPVITGQLEDFETTQKFDFIRLNHVLEHMAHPVQELARVRNMMHDGSVLHIEVPNFQEYCRSKSPGNIFHFGHIYNFDGHTLRATAAKAGLMPVYATSDTSIYFTKCAPFIIEPNESNAQYNFDAFSLNLQGSNTSAQNRIVKLLRNGSSILKEQLAILKFGNRRAIIENQANQLRRLLGV